MILKGNYGDHKYFRSPYLWDKNFEVLRLVVALDKVDLTCEKQLKQNLLYMIQVLLPTPKKLYLWYMVI